MTTLKHLTLFLFLGGIMFSCSGSQQASDNIQPATTEIIKPSVSDHYTSSFPRQDVTEELKKAQQSVVRIFSTAFYDNYSFDEQYITLDDIKTNDPKDISADYFSSEESSAGTSIILDQNDTNSLLITCEHTVSYPDTAITYYEGEEVPPQTYIESISIKRRQNNLVFLGQNLASYEVISTDKRLDLALINLEFGLDKNLDQHKLMTKIGDSDALQLGSFLYILGFPKGYPMITKGLASSSESWNDRFFITDATFNPGISGGLILASKDNFNSFEWIGMASSSSATRENVLVPRPVSDEYSRATRPYSDSVFVQRQTRINYGITQAVPANKIKEFLRDNQEVISRNNFSIEESLITEK